MFKASEVALQLGISRRHVYSLYQKGELVGYRFGDAVCVGCVADSSHTILIALTTRLGRIAGRFDACESQCSKDHYTDDRQCRLSASLNVILVRSRESALMWGGVDSSLGKIAELPRDRHATAL